MKNFVFATAAAVAALAATPAAAQSADEGFYAGAQAGYHHIDEIDFSDLGVDLETDIDGVVYGGFLGYTFPTEGNMVIGAEGNFLFGNDAIDQEYGVSGLLGTRVGTNSKVYARAGYQWVDLDTNGIAGEVADDFGLTGTDRDTFVDLVEAGVDGDDTGSGFLLGAGADVGIGDRAFVRANVDTVEFETLRLTAGVGVRF